ncbi:MAG: hypothetical protein II917_07145 [Synergistaceae bacterium]|nr:hypothetical protein [Synergistaceae bacterium]
MTEYFLMNKNVKLLFFHIKQDENGQYYCEEIRRYVDKELLPPGFCSIHNWIDRRDYAKHKEHLHRWLRQWQIDTLKGFVDITHALGLNDTLWVKGADENLSWENVSLYSNNFDDVAAKTAFTKGLQGLQLSSTSPEFTSEGSFEKCWVRNSSGIIKLYKKGTEGFANAGLEPYSEFYSAQLSQIICQSALNYNLNYFKKHLVSSCTMFTDEQNGFVPIYRYLDNSKTYRFAEIIAFLEQFGLSEEFRDMIVLDAVILNPDRHLGNFGFIVDNDTFHIKSFAPVFDHNMALIARGMNNSMEQDTEYVKSLGHKLGSGYDFVKMAKTMLTARTRSILHQLQDFEFARHKSYNLPAKRLRYLSKLVQRQIHDILS